MAEELTRSLSMLAQRGVPRGAAAVLEDARADSAPRGAASVPRRLRPAWVAAISFGATLVLIGGTVGVGVFLGRTESDVGSISETVGDVTTSTAGRWLLVPVLVAAAALFALIANRQIRTRKEKHMMTTDDTM
ncbi:MAG: hypothetical protein HKO63_08615, partial [Acidimicrobiia bacterium]|nr:hypothetical protein [Acidimicrobiia bacterium]